ncbi:MAG: thiamine phosphate synthase [Desulfobacterales bacterium]|nr:thiamine phosphate synthase [Desulfobacterales bacterium]
MKQNKEFFSTDRRDIYCFADNMDICRKLLTGGANIIQLRNKHIDDTAFKKLAEEMLSLARDSDAILIINDRVDIAIEIMADGIHIGLEDENYREVITRAPDNMIVGVSVDTVKEAVEAEQAGAAYVGAGAVFPTPTKGDAVVIGIDELHNIVRAVKVPVVAIGGISMENIQQVVETGAQYYAIISDINNSQDIPARLNEFFTIIG